MRSPFRYRPGVGDLEWEDNATSNFLAWFSHITVRNWCQSEEHWTAGVFNHLWAECGCCLLFRGITIGFVLGVITSTVAAILLT